MQAPSGRDLALEEHDMKRALLALAASVLGSGCIVSSTPAPQVGDVDVFWEFWRYAPAQQGGSVVYDPIPNATVPGPDRACTDSGVDTVYVSYPGFSSPALSCLRSGMQGVALQNVPAGSVQITVSGYRGGVKVYESTYPVDVYDGSLAQYDFDVEGVNAPMELWAEFQIGTALANFCDVAGNPAVTYTIVDHANTVIWSAANTAAVPCPGTTALPLPVFPPAGLNDSLDFDDYSVRMYGYEGATLSYDSGNVAVQHYASQAGQQGVDVTLVHL